jgi:hypothetical protein
MRRVAAAASSSGEAWGEDATTWVFSASAGDGAELTCRVISSAGSCVLSGSSRASVMVSVVPLRQVKRFG